MDLRVSILPVVYGEKIVIRVLNTGNNNITKEQLGMTKENMKKLDNIIGNPHGIILVTGPTESGKSTSLWNGNRFRTGGICKRFCCNMYGKYNTNIWSKKYIP